MPSYTRQFPSKSSTAIHTTTIDDVTGKVSWCSCPAYRNKKDGQARTCPHKREIEGETPDDSLVLRRRVDAIRQKASAPAPLTRDVARRRTVLVRERLSESSDLPPAAMRASAMTTPIEGAAFDAAFAHGWAMEQKMDGHRMAVVVSGVTVRAYAHPRVGKEMKPRTLPADMIDVLMTLPNGVYDGELCAEGGISSDVTRLGAKLVMVLFDCVELNGRDLRRQPYYDRRDALLIALLSLPEGQTCVSTVESLPPSWAGVEAVWAAGGEGVIVKRTDSIYQTGRRSDDWRKVKRGGVAAGTIVAFEEGANGPYSAFSIRLDSGVMTSVKTLNNAVRRLIAASPSKYLNARFVISHKGLLASGKPRHPMYDHLAGPGE